MDTKSRRQLGFVLKLFLCLIAVGAAYATSVATVAASPAIVTQSGPLKGIETPTTNEYLGIPYAVPPVGSLRWTPPQPHGRWHGVFEATQFGSFCTQPDGFGGTFGREDCLTLNVYTPSEKKNQNKHHGLPVMVWIHGGALVTGGGGFYDPTRIVEQGGVVVVTINYRLGLLGFFAHPAIDAEGHLNGNYGLMDQQLALRWVRRNIAAFGGDAHRVTIFGESAGGQSVYSNLASPASAGLFQRAISESGAYAEFQIYWDPISIVPLAQAETIGTSLVPSGTALAARPGVGCASQTARCLRSVTASNLVLVEPGTLYPFVDGTILIQTLTAAFASGQFNRVPIISGGNHDDWRLFVADQYDAIGHPLASEADYETAVDALWGGFGPTFETFILALYPLANYSITPPIPGDPSPSPGIALGASGTDGIFACPERNSVALLSIYVPTFAYEFNDENAYLVFDLFPPPFPPITFPLGAAHFTEVPYLFDTFSTSSIFSPAQQLLSESMISYWTTFAATGDPNSACQPGWSPYSPMADEFQSLVPPMPTVEATFDSDHKCSSFWNPS